MVHVDIVTDSVKSKKGLFCLRCKGKLCTFPNSVDNLMKPNWLKDLKHKMEKDDSNSMSFEIVDKKAIEQSTNGEKSGKSVKN